MFTIWSSLSNFQKMTFGNQELQNENTFIWNLPIIELFFINERWEEPETVGRILRYFARVLLIWSFELHMNKD